MNIRKSPLIESVIPTSPSLREIAEVSALAAADELCNQFEEVLENFKQDVGYITGRLHDFSAKAAHQGDQEAQQKLFHLREKIEKAHVDIFLQNVWISSMRCEPQVSCEKCGRRCRCAVTVTSGTKQ